MDKTGFFVRNWRFVAPSLFSAMTVFGCVGADPMKKHVNALETEVRRLRADADRAEERIAALELSSQVSSRSAPEAPKATLEHPRLKIIHLSPDDEAPATDEPADVPPSEAAGAPSDRRPIIRGTGDRVIKVGDLVPDESSANDVGRKSASMELAKDAHGN
jgi:hypothetical protein